MVGNGGEARVGATGEPESSVQLGGVTIALKGAVNLSYFVSARHRAAPWVFSSFG